LINHTILLNLDGTDDAVTTADRSRTALTDAAANVTLERRVKQADLVSTGAPDG
jgi:hypothetical protein